MAVLPDAVLLGSRATAAPVSINSILHFGSFLSGRTITLLPIRHSACLASGVFAKIDNHQ
jgi:hypothetical protein